MQIKGKEGKKLQLKNVDSGGNGQIKRTFFKEYKTFNALEND